MQKTIPAVNKKLKKGEMVIVRTEPPHHDHLSGGSAADTPHPTQTVNAVTSATIQRTMHFVRQHVPEKIP